jgi:ABC-type dipeptide/oligopeptide/nickel transport system permease component
VGLEQKLMASFLLRRLLAVLPVLAVVSVVVFLILRLAPGDPAAVIAGNNATSEDIANIRSQLGLGRQPDQPIRYLVGQGAARRFGLLLLLRQAGA